MPQVFRDRNTLTSQWYYDRIPLRNDREVCAWSQQKLRYIELKNQICRQIYEGICRDGEKIPSERQLSEDFNVSRITVRKALELLEEEGLILREVGKRNHRDAEKSRK